MERFAFRLVVGFVGERVDADLGYSFRAAEVPFYFEEVAALEYHFEVAFESWP